jgi:hypothetical protein
MGISNLRPLAHDHLNGCILPRVGAPDVQRSRNPDIRQLILGSLLGKVLPMMKRVFLRGCKAVNQVLVVGQCNLNGRGLDLNRHGRSGNRDGEGRNHGSNLGRDLSRHGRRSLSHHGGLESGIGGDELSLSGVVKGEMVAGLLWDLLDLEDGRGSGDGGGSLVDVKRDRHLA